MGLQKRDKEFRTGKISYLDFKHMELDRVLIGLFPRLKYKGFTSRQRRKLDLTLSAFIDEFAEHPEWFSGFDTHRETAAKWIETNLMDIVSRGRPSQAIASPRPLHGDAYKFRNPKHSRDYGASQQIYWLLYHGGQTGVSVLEHLKRFFFVGLDFNTDQYDHRTSVDVETQAIMRLTSQVKDDIPDSSDQDRFPPLCTAQAQLMAEDVMRLLVYQRFIPRSVMVEYLKILLGLHLALYHLKLLKMVPMLVRRRNGDRVCGPERCPASAKGAVDPQTGCPYRVGLVVDMAGQAGTPAAQLAERSADTHYRRIPGFIKGYFQIKKLDEFADQLADNLHRVSKPSRGYFTVDELLGFLDKRYEKERDKFFGQRLHGLLEAAGEDSSVDPEVLALTRMGLPDMEAYIEVLAAIRGDFHRKYLTDALDSMLLKNRPGAAIAQPRTKHASRRFIMDSQLLEVLLQIAVLVPDNSQRGFHTAELRVDQLLDFLRERYGLFIDRLPAGDGFPDTSINDREALRANVVAFKDRLREVGFFRDLSDAYITQTVTPRYPVKDE